MIVASVLSLVFFPVVIAASIAIKLDTRGPVFADTPKRVGRSGKEFRLYKFRSMICNAHQLLRTDPKFKDLYEKYKQGSYKLSIDEDPRITKVGKFIRKYSIDEIPQIVNVFKGEMSMVGPRPYYPDELKEQQKKRPHTRDLVREVMTVRPGISGLWQVSGRSDVDFEKRIQLDAYYARKRSLLLDIMILAKTPFVMLSGKGAI